jgi:hypothetical protein
MTLSIRGQECPEIQGVLWTKADGFLSIALSIGGHGHVRL